MTADECGCGEFRTQGNKRSGDRFGLAGKFYLPPVSSVAGIDGSGQIGFVVASFCVAMRCFHCFFLCNQSLIFFSGYKKSYNGRFVL
jgi:hypothetical protein